MTRVLSLLGFCLLLAVGSACRDKSGSADASVTGGGGTGGGGAFGGSGGASAGSAGATAGTGGGGGITLRACPSAPPAMGAACEGTFTCNYTSGCRCNVCCYSGHQCVSGRIMFLGFNDGCEQPWVCADAATDAGDGAVPDAASAAVCTPGANQSCNDNPAWSSIHGQCTDAGTCVCGDAGTNPASGRCR